MLVRFLKFVELSTKLVSVLAFFTGFAYTVYAYGAVNWTNTILFFVSMLLFDMTTTGVNNFIDKRAEGAKPHFSTLVSHFILVTMLGISIAFGLILVWRCGIVVLLVGIFCFIMGLAYTLGPAPISRTPYGELFSGTVMGLAIPFLTVYVNVPQEMLFYYDWQAPFLVLRMDFWAIASIVAISIPCVLATSNIMLANNTCDVQKDIAVRRYTLPYYIGQQKALFLFASIYMLIGLTIPVLVLLKIAPPITLLTEILAIPVFRNVKIFIKNPVKSETFILAVKNFTWINTMFPLTFILGMVIR